MPTLLTKLTRRAARLGGWCPGYVPLVRRSRARAVAVVMYHGVSPAPLPAFNWCHIDRAAFARQIEFLARHYTVLPLRDVVAALRDHKPLPRHTAVITFDDGFRSVLTEAGPVLRHFGTPATVFLVTSLLENGRPPWPQLLYHALVETTRPRVEFGGRAWDLEALPRRAQACAEIAARLKALDDAAKDEALARLLDDLGCRAVPDDSPVATLRWDEVEPLADSDVFDFGSHTHTHPILARCSLARQEEELRVSRDLLRRRLGRCDLLAYPNGTRADFTDATRRLARRLGYHCALATEPGLNRPDADLYALQRVNVGADTTPDQFERLLAGL